MKLKLDENFGRRCIDILSDAGHNVATVASQQMSGAADEDVIQAAVLSHAASFRSISISQTL
jgi:predicted nuclease of predicted toxin-antitoxin system